MRYFVKVFIFAVLNIFLFAGLSHAEKVTFVKEYTYQASEDDSKNSSRTITLREIKKLLLEELGVYLESETEVKDFKLTKDHVSVYTAGIVSVEIIGEKWDGKRYWLKAKISADPKEVVKSIDKLRKDRDKTRELQEIKKRSDFLLDEVERLKKELETTKADIKEKKKSEYEETVRKLSAVEWVEKAKSLFQKENYKEIIEALTNAINLDPKYAEAYGMRGAALLEISDYKGAIEDFNKGIELTDPQDAGNLSDLYRRRANANVRNAQYMSAIEDAEKAVSLGESFIWFDKLEYSNLIKKYPNNHLLYLFRGIYHINTSMFHKEGIKLGMNDIKKAIKLNPNYALSYYWLGRGYKDLIRFNDLVLKKETDDKIYQNGIEAFTKAIELKMKVSQGMNVFYDRGGFFKSLGKYKEAVRDFTAAIEIDPKDYNILRDRADVYMILHQYEDALEDRNKEIDLLKTRYLNPTEFFSPDARQVADKDKDLLKSGYGILLCGEYNQRGYVYFLLDRFQSAIEDFSIVLGSCGKAYRYSAYQYRGISYLELKDYKKAIENFEKTIELDSKNWQGYYWLGDTYLDLSNYDEAIKHYDSALKINPKLADAYFNRGAAHAKLKNYRLAMIDWDHAAKLDNKNYLIYYNRGIILFKQSLYKQAIKEFDRAIQINPTADKAYYYRGLNYSGLGNKEKFIADMQIAARLGHKEAQDDLRKAGERW